VEAALAPVVPVVRLPERVAFSAEEEAATSWKVLEPHGEVVGDGVEQVHGAVDAAGLLALELAYATACSTRMVSPPMWLRSSASISPGQTPA
jgi:hypothetical protein